MTSIRVCAVCLVVALVCTSRPTYAQGPNNNLSSRVAALEAAVAALQNSLTAEADTRAAADTALGGRVSKLEGNITAGDLVGTYTIAGIQTRLIGGGVFNAGIASGALSGSLTLNGNGTGTMQINGDGSLLNTVVWDLVPYTLGNGNPGIPFDINWTFANGALTLTVVGFGQVGPGIPVGPGGRLVVASVPEFHGGQADVSLLIFYRLQ